MSKTMMVHAPGMGWGAKSQKCRLAPSVKHTGQESGGELCEIFKCWLFLQSKSVNSVCKVLQLLGTSSQTPYRGFPPWTTLGDFHPPGLLGYSPKQKFLAPSLTTVRRSMRIFNGRTSALQTPPLSSRSSSRSSPWFLKWSKC